jgi:Zn-dependent M28 family amino/carboxypeptidase
MDGRGFGEAVDDDGSGTALVMEVARVLSGADVETDRSIRFAL